MKKYKLITRADLDGVVSAILLKKINLVDKVEFAHPKDMQDGKIKVTDDDIITNLPYNQNAHFVFDHHFSEDVRAYSKRANHIINSVASSAARVIYEYFGGADKFPAEWSEMIDSVDRADTAKLSLDDIENPKGWYLLNYIVDPRTGLGRYDDKFRLSNFDFMRELIEFCQTHTVIEEILEQPDLKERIEFYKKESESFKKQLKNCSKVYENAVVLDLRGQDTIHVGNRFMLYTMYPECNLSIHCLMGHDKTKTVYALGKSIINRTSKVNVGELTLMYGGGGHKNAGTCQIENENAAAVLKELIAKVNS